MDQKRLWPAEVIGDKIVIKKEKMKTTETIEGIEVEIDWDFVEIVERHDSNWCDWAIIGEGSDGKVYQANCGADGWHPYDFHDDPENIEEV